MINMKYNSYARRKEIEFSDVVVGTEVFVRITMRELDSPHGVHVIDVPPELIIAAGKQLQPESSNVELVSEDCICYGIRLDWCGAHGD